MKKILALLLVVVLSLALLTACGNSTAAQPTAAEEPSYKIVLISNQKSGDMGPVDAMFAGAKRAEADFGVTIKTMEVTDAASYEEEIRAMAKEGYDLILTTFPPMTEATKAVAKDYPDVKFCGIFQYINVDGETYPNVWDTEYRGEECTYVTGAIAAALSDSGILGYISGDEAAGVCEACSGFMQGALSVNPDIEVKFMAVNSYEDPAKAKEIANAMIAQGVDVFQTDAGNSQIGVIEAANEASKFVSGDVSDNSALCPDGFYSYVGIDFGENVYLAVKHLLAGDYPGGEHGFMNIASGTYFVDLSLLDNLAKRLPDQAEKFAAAKAAGQAAIDGIQSGDITVVHDIEMPSLDRVKNY
ncbi:MAG: BMP family ABC transporter substrate-binding protein [Oscillospiraceae bacterium]|nr:BMP family ABC transporter substrate-binding protein [Oscillospiraceae bacterium]